MLARNFGLPALGEAIVGEHFVQARGTTNPDEAESFSRKFSYLLQLGRYENSES